ncbi:hypothetical protein [Aeromonas caviae]|uniref:hypothetical protein n=1 Tax=Aeromonas caviae TaxID=648 RepID=UPI000AA278F3|nr:hypothetical protein [Aeromonas caviae]
MQQVQSADGRALMHVLSGLTRLRRLCCSPQLVMPEWSQTSSTLHKAMAAQKAQLEETPATPKLDLNLPEQ